MTDRISVTLSDENKAWLDANVKNISGYVNDLVTKAREGEGHVDDAVRQYRIAELEEELKSLRGQAEAKQERLEQLREEAQRQRQEEERTRDEILDCAVDALTPTHWLDTLSKEEQIPSVESEQVQELASQAGMEPEEFRAEAVDRILRNNE